MKKIICAVLAAVSCLGFAACMPSCVEKAQEKIAAKGHTFGEAVVTKEATETEEGIKTTTCTACGETKEDVIPNVPAEPENPSDDANADTDSSIGDEGNKDNNMSWIIIAIVAVVVLAGVVATIILIKKKKSNVVE